MSAFLKLSGLSLLALATCHSHPPCRFAPLYTQEQIATNPEPFVQDVLYWEGHFAQADVGFKGANGMTYDGTLLNQKTGLELKDSSGLHNFSAASKESLHVMILAQALAGNPSAATVVSPDVPGKAAEVAYEIMKTKLDTYLAFNESYPGFGGILPWYNNTFATIEPTSDWVDRVPGLDNGELLWAVYGAVRALETSSKAHFRSLGKQWQVWLDYTKENVARMFYLGNGKICAVVDLKQDLAPNDPKQNYTCEGASAGSPGLLNDPYEGELFAWWIYFYGGLSDKEKKAIWVAKRPQLKSVEYHERGVGPITVQEGFWFSSHEQWKVLEMPYYDVNIFKRVYTNAERARTCHSASFRIPGEFASVNNVTDSDGQIIGYISATGIPSISSQGDFENDVVTPYGVYPTLLVEGEKGRAAGMAWWWNMVMGKKMQNPYGSTESERRDGTAISSFVSWDSKITTVAALLGGVANLVREKMKVERTYGDFLRVTDREYSRVFTHLKGEDTELCLPKSSIPDTGLKDYTKCKRDLESFEDDSIDPGNCRQSSADSQRTSSIKGGAARLTGSVHPPSNSSKTGGPATGSGYAFAESCQAALRAWSSSSSSYGQENGHESTSYYTSTMTLPEVSYGSTTVTSLVTLCDGHPRVVGQTTAEEEKTSTVTSAYTNTNPTFVFASYPTPKPCELSNEDCLLLESSWTSHYNEILKTRPDGPRGGLLAPPCTTYRPSLTYSTDSAGHTCDSCLIVGRKIRLLYWPVTTRASPGHLCHGSAETITATPTSGAPNTFVTDGITITSPSVAISIAGLSRADQCGRTISTTIIPVLPEDVSSVEGARALFTHRPFNFANLNYRCMDDPEEIYVTTQGRTDCYQEVPASAYFFGHANAAGHGYWQPSMFANSTIWDNYQPQVLPPNTMTDAVHSIWGSDCIFHPDGVWDPPIALGKENKIPLPHGPDAPTEYATPTSNPAAPALPTFAHPSVTHTAGTSEHSGHDKSPNDQPQHDQSPHDQSPHGQSPHGQSPQGSPAATDTAGTSEHSGHDQSPNDSSPHDQSPQGQSPQDSPAATQHAGSGAVHVVHTTMLTFPAKQGAHVFTALWGSEGTTFLNAESTIKLPTRPAGPTSPDAHPGTVGPAPASPGSDPASANSGPDPASSKPTFYVDGSKYTVDPMDQGGFKIKGQATTIQIHQQGVQNGAQSTGSASTATGLPSSPDQSASPDQSLLPNHSSSPGQSSSPDQSAYPDHSSSHTQPSPSGFPPSPDRPSSPGHHDSSGASSPSSTNVPASNLGAKQTLTTCFNLSLLAIFVAWFL